MICDSFASLSERDSIPELIAHQHGHRVKEGATGGRFAVEAAVPLSVGAIDGLDLDEPLACVERGNEVAMDRWDRINMVENH